MGELRAPVWFVETKRFTASWSDLRLKADDLLALQDVIREDPTFFPVVRGAGGLRKMRFAPASSGKGKRGALRVCYAYLPRFAVIVLAFVYRKNEDDTLTADDKKAVRKWLRELEEDLERRSDLGGLPS